MTAMCTTPGLHSQRAHGYTLLETVIVVTIVIVLMGVVLSVATEAMALRSYTEADTVSQNQAEQAFRRSTEILRKCGWSTLDGTDYPSVNEDEDQVSFRVLDDLDGNNFAFDAGTGELEWSTQVFNIQLDPDTRLLQVFNGNTPVWTLGSSIESATFQTFVEDGALNIRELRVTIVSTRTTSDGNELTNTATGSVFMRN